MKITVITLFIFCATLTFSQNSANLIIGKAEKIYSNELKEEREIFVYTPSGSKNGECYPVLYLLDAEDHFYATVGMIKQMTGRWPAMIVVGIVNTNRSRDLTPLSMDANSGTGNPFISFIEKELIPHIESNYQAAPYRIFSGHSLGGLTVINTLLNNTGFFNAYIAIDPSLWWNNQKLIAQAKKDFSTKKFDNISLFVGRARNMPPGMDTLTALKDTTEYTMLFRSVTRFVEILNETPNNGLRWESKFYPDESHGTVQLNGQYDALKFLFNYYQFRTSIFELNPALDMDSTLQAHFENVSRHLGYKVLPSESLVNNLGYTCMGLEKWDKAEAFFKLNIKNYPQSANCYDSLGDFYQSRGNINQAIENYRKALTLGDDQGTKQKLEFLMSKKR